MGNSTGIGPQNPTRYLGANVYLNIVVSRNRRPTGADYRQPETGVLYQVATIWQVSKNPTTGVEGELWMLSKIVSNIAYWIEITPEGSGGLTINYTNVTTAMSPYTVLATDNYLSVDCSGGVVTLDFPNVPSADQIWVVKDRTGNSATNNITITTTGGTVTFDGATSYVMKTNYQSIQLIANSTPTYEVY
jgi:hypothetical protein